MLSCVRTARRTGSATSARRAAKLQLEAARCRRDRHSRQLHTPRKRGQRPGTSLRIDGTKAAASKQHRACSMGSVAQHLRKCVFTCQACVVCVSSVCLKVSDTFGQSAGPCVAPPAVRRSRSPGRRSVQPARRFSPRPTTITSASRALSHSSPVLQRAQRGVGAHPRQQSVAHKRFRQVVVLALKSPQVRVSRQRVHHAAAPAPRRQAHSLKVAASAAWARPPQQAPQARRLLSFGRLQSAREQSARIRDALLVAGQQACLLPEV
jgi:hypothetical protein